MNEDTVTVDTEEGNDPWKLTKEDLLEGILDHCANIEAVGEQAIEIAIDITLAEVSRHLGMLDFDFAAEAVDEIKDN